MHSVWSYTETSSCSHCDIWYHALISLQVKYNITVYTVRHTLCFFGRSAFTRPEPFPNRVTAASLPQFVYRSSLGSSLQLDRIITTQIGSPSLMPAFHTAALTQNRSRSKPRYQTRAIPDIYNIAISSHMHLDHNHMHENMRHPRQPQYYRRLTIQRRIIVVCSPPGATEFLGYAN